MAHSAFWWKVMDGLAKAMYERGLAEEPKAQTWSIDGMAAESLGWPLLRFQAMVKSSGQLVPVKAYQLR
ncbi:MAG: hypothetical protein MMC23_008584 [Stictis urceolatum]|nr:hypothetical protein [Stictis urceolata]